MSKDIENWTDKIHKGDCRDVLEEIPSNSVDLVVTSPPYNVGIEYGDYDDSISMDEYSELLKDTFDLLDEVVKDNGRVCVNVSLKNDKNIYDIPILVKNISNRVGWQMRFEIIWNKGTSESSSAWGSWRSPSSPRPIFNHEFIFIFDVGEEKKESIKTLEKEEFMEYVKSVWDINPDTSSKHPASFPEEVPKRLIKLNTYENDVILDPFIGSGTTAVVAEQLNRHWIGIDLNKEYVEMSYKRVEKETGKIFDNRSLFDY